mgnify:CR=1 FL=1
MPGINICGPLAALVERLAQPEPDPFWQLRGSDTRFWCRVVAPAGAPAGTWIASSAARANRDAARADGLATGLRELVGPAYLTGAEVTPEDAIWVAIVLAAYAGCLLVAWKLLCRR